MKPSTDRPTHQVRGSGKAAGSAVSLAAVATSDCGAVGRSRAFTYELHPLVHAKAQKLGVKPSMLLGTAKYHRKVMVARIELSLELFEKGRLTFPEVGRVTRVSKHCAYVRIQKGRALRRARRVALKGS